MSQSRRNFLQHSLCATLGTASASALFNTLGHAAITSATAVQNDYKALVCVFLFGGNDADNTLIPYRQSDHNAYAAGRGILAIPRDQLLPITPTTNDGRDFALHPSFSEMRTLFAERKLAIIANVGVLLTPTTRQQYLQNTAPLPPHLFSHNDQQTQWQSGWADEIAKTGWGGRLADRLNVNNPAAQLSMSVSLDGTNTFQVGNQVLPYTISPDGVINSYYYNDHWDNPETFVTKNMLGATYNNVFERSYRDVFKRALENAERLSGALTKAPPLTTVFPNLSLAKQLQMAAKLISLRNELGLRRQIFFCTAEGYDTHSEQIETHAKLLGELSQSLAAFYKATIELGVADKVTTFTSSDFGRTYKTNGKGSDHGWGGHHFVLGGAVKGGEIYGRVPTHVIGGPDDTSEGRWIPTVAADEYAATLAQWLGASASDLPDILPNINRFNRINLGFMA
jgi:uncharacterized protein (DUF1501 family)